MPRRVFFSFHYARDIRRVVQVRNSWIFRPGGESQPFLDKAEWEAIKRTGRRSVENWINKQLNGTSVTVVLIGAETYTREWVQYEIKRSYELKKGLLGIYLDQVRDPLKGQDYRGLNPFQSWTVNHLGVSRPLSDLVRTYCWVGDNGYQNISSWIEQAALGVGRR